MPNSIRENLANSPLPNGGAAEYSAVQTGNGKLPSQVAMLVDTACQTQVGNVGQCECLGQSGLGQDKLLQGELRQSEFEQDRLLQDELRQSRIGQCEFGCQAGRLLESDSKHCQTIADNLDEKDGKTLPKSIDRGEHDVMVGWMLGIAIMAALVSILVQILLRFTR